MNRLSCATIGLLVIVTLLIASTVVDGQGRQPVRAAAHFEVVSIRAADVDDRKSAMVPRLWGDDGTGRVSLHHIPLKYVFMRAFDVREDQIAGPAWLETDFFDILATAPKSSQKEEISAMLRNMLVDRFKLVSHMDSKTSPVYALTVSPKGLRMKEAPETPAPPEPEGPETVKIAGSGENKTISSHGQSVFGPYAYSATKEGQDMVITTVYSSMTMPGLSTFLTQSSDHPVVDMTGLKGHYEITIRWVPQAGRPIDADGNAVPPPDLVPESLDKLGLKLVRQDVKIDKLTIDHIERKPTEN